MNNDLWNKILAYDLDHPVSDYGFSARLANENYWTKNFTKKAIIEYKKFMYLAATSDLMVSPSEIVDTVWHQHLIFTQSYHAFCDLMGKQIQHVPSTHNKDEFEKFNQAKERTKKLYHNTFGEQPAGIWNYAGMYESLALDKSNIKIRSFILLSILIFAALLVPAYFLLEPWYVQINNPGFMIGFIAMAGLTFLVLEAYNVQYLSNVLQHIDRASFLFDLQPLELVYLQTGKPSAVVNGVVNQLIIDKMITVNRNGTLEKVPKATPRSMEEYQVLDTLEKSGKRYYQSLLDVLTYKHIFWNTPNCLDALKKYFNKSKKFGTLFYTNTGVLLIVLLFGLTRFMTGLLRGKPVDLIGFCLVLLIVAIIAFLGRLTTLTCTKIIPRYYKNQLTKSSHDVQDLQWRYFLLGSVALAASFAPLVAAIDKTDSGSSSDSGSSCGSSCSSCGGCGGD